jgi:hypothetical protein
LIREQVTWSLPQMSFGALPSGLVAEPVGWEGYWVRLSGFSATATSEAGPGSAAPVRTVAGQVRYWNGAGYSDVDVTTAGAQVPIVALDHTAVIGDGSIVRVEIGGTLLIDPSPLQETLDDSTGETIRTEGLVDLGSPLAGQLTYRVTRNETVVADLTMEVNAGTGRASASYQAVPE